MEASAGSVPLLESVEWPRLVNGAALCCALQRSSALREEPIRSVNNTPRKKPLASKPCSAMQWSSLPTEVGSARAQLFRECVAWQMRRKAEEVGGCLKLTGSERRRALGSRRTKNKCPNGTSH